MKHPVFPARAGMSPNVENYLKWAASVPRASGDEPTTSAVALGVSWCSPRERG